MASENVGRYLTNIRSTHVAVRSAFLPSEGAQDHLATRHQQYPGSSERQIGLSTRGGPTTFNIILQLQLPFGRTFT